MPSRESRRRIERNADKKSEQEKRIERHPAIYIISFVILVIVVVSFIFTGSAGRFGQGFRNQVSFGRYDNKDLEVLRASKVQMPLNFFTSRLDASENELKQAKDDATRKYYWKEAFDDSIFHYKVLDLILPVGYSVSKDAIATTIGQLPIYRNENGDFDENKYLQTSMLERSMINQLLEEEAVHKYFIDDTLFSQNTGNKENEFYRSMAARERKFNFVSFKYADYPTEKTTDYGKANLEKFKRIKLSRILLSKKTQAEAEQIQNTYIKNEKSFEDLAKTYSQDVYANQGGDMGQQYFYQITNYIDTVETVRKIFALKKNELSGIIKNGDNWEIYRCNEGAVDPDFKDSNTQKAIFNYMMKSDRGVIEDYAMNLAKDFKDKASKKSFADACREIKQYPAYETEFFPINYLNLFPGKDIKVKGNGPDISSASSKKEFFQEAFSISKDVISKPISLDDQIIVLKLADEKTANDDDWKSASNNFKTNITQTYQMLIQYGYAPDPVAKYYVNKSYAISRKNNLPLQYLLGTILEDADQSGMQCEYAFDKTFAQYKELEDVITNMPTKKLEDSFEATYKAISVKGKAE
jgi:hypothetical protein